MYKNSLKNNLKALKITKTQWKIGLAPKYAKSRKSTVFFQSSWYFCKMTTSWIRNFGIISAWLDENCRFFIDTTFLCQSYFLLLIPYV